MQWFQAYAFMLLQAAMWLALGAAVTAVNWHRPTRLAGAMLLIYSAVSSASFFAVPVQLFEMKLVLEISLVTLIAAGASVLMWEHDADWPYRIVLGAAVADVAFCGILSLLSGTHHSIRWTFAAGTNLTYLVMCMAVAYPGMRDRYVRWISAIHDLRASNGETPADFCWAIRRLEESE